MTSLIDKVSVPEGQSGPWRVERFEIDGMGSAIGLFSYGHRAPRPGKYTRLMRGGQLVMSDTDAEQRDHWTPVIRANGHCLINGLGLGMVLAACLRRPKVAKVTVVENSPDVIALVAQSYRSDARVEIVLADAFEYQPPRGVRYGMVWHDIWDDLCEDNLPEMHKLHRKYGKRTDWQGSWGRYEIERRAGR